MNYGESEKSHPAPLLALPDAARVLLAPNCPVVSQSNPEEHNTLLQGTLLITAIRGNHGDHRQDTPTLAGTDPPRRGKVYQQDLCKSGADQRTIGRILHSEQSPTVEMLDKLAGALGLHAWQLLIPNLDPRNPPVFILSQTERDFYRKLDELRVAEPPAHIYKVNSE